MIEAFGGYPVESVAKLDDVRAAAGFETLEEERPVAGRVFAMCAQLIGMFAVPCALCPVLFLFLVACVRKERNRKGEAAEEQIVQFVLVAQIGPHLATRLQDGARVQPAGLA